MANNEERNEEKNNCTFCAENPEAHSFFCYQSSEKPYLYKTIVADSVLYNDPESIIHHMEYDPYLMKEPMLEWEWSIDMRNAHMKHYLAFNTVREISKWIDREKDNKCKNLKKIVVLNEVYYLMSPLIHLAKMFLPGHIEIVVSGD